MTHRDEPDMFAAYRLEDSLGFLVNQASRSIRRRFDGELDSRGLRVTGEQFGILVHLWHQGGRYQKDLAEMLAKDKTTMARLVRGLELQGMVARVPDAKDRRHNHVYLTELGRDSMAGLTDAAQTVLAAAARDVDPRDLSVCKDVLRLVHASLESTEPRDEGAKG